MSQSTENTADVSLAQQAADLIDARVTDLARPGQLSLKVLAADLQTRAHAPAKGVFARGGNIAVGLWRGKACPSVSSATQVRAKRH